MIVEFLEQHDRDLALAENAKPRRWNRASSIGRCPLELANEKLIADWCAANPGRPATENEYGIKRDPLTPRIMHLFARGNVYDDEYKDKIAKACPWCVPIPLGSWPSVMIEGQEITGTPDFIILPHGEWKTVGLGEIKSMSEFAFDRAVAGNIDDTYCAQAWVYSQQNDLNPVCFICVKKNTDHICEVVFDRNATETIITKRYGGNELEIAANDPLLIAEVRSPFNESIEKKVRETVKSVSLCDDLSKLPVGVRTVEKELFSAQGKAKAEEAKKRYGEPTKINGQWSYFETGREILGWPCNYCGFKQNCFPGVQLELDNGKPKWIVPAND